MDMAEAIDFVQAKQQVHRSGCLCPKCKGQKVDGKITTRKLKIDKPATKKQFNDKVKELHDKQVVNLDPKRKKTVEAGGPGSGRHSSYGGYKLKSRADKDAQGGLHAKYKNGNHQVNVIDNRSADKGVVKGRGAVVVTHQFHTDDESTDHSRKEFNNIDDAQSHLKSTYGINHI